MKIKKDKKYFGVYLTCVICATILTIGVIAFVIYFLVKDDFKIWLISIPLLAIIADLFAFNSFIGYMKTPEIVLEVKGEKIILTPDRKKETTEILINDVKSLELKRPIFCRSGKRMIISTITQRYYLEDIYKIEEAYDELLNVLKGL